MIVSLRHPTDGRSTPCTRRSRRRSATCRSICTRSRCARAARLAAGCGAGRLLAALRLWLRDLARDLTAQPRPPLRPGAGARGRAAGRHRPGCTCTICTRPPRSPATPPSCAVCRCSVSAHAKDIWTTPDWEKREKLADCALAGDLHRRLNRDHLRALAPAAEVELVYHGLDAGRFPAPARALGPDGSDPARPVRSCRRRARGGEEGPGRAARGAGGAAARAALALRAMSAAARCAQELDGPGAQRSASPSGSPGAAPLPQDGCSTAYRARRSVRAREPDRAGRRPRRPAERAAGGGGQELPWSRAGSAAIPELVEDGVNGPAGAAGRPGGPGRGARGADRAIRRRACGWAAPARRARARAVRAWRPASTGWRARFGVDARAGEADAA